jgi:hypothetical protein
MLALSLGSGCTGPTAAEEPVHNHEGHEHPSGDAPPGGGSTGQFNEGGAGGDLAGEHSHGTFDGGGAPAPITDADPYAVLGDVWSNPATWGGAVPGTATDVTIPAGKSITLDVNACVKTITVRGTLVFADKDLELCARWISVENGGRLVVGTHEKRFTRRAVITFIDGDRNENIAGMGTKFLAVMMGGRVDLHGESGITSWTKMANPSTAGATSLSLVDAAGWKVGDSIVVTTGSSEPNETETRSVTAISGNQVTLDRALQYARPGTLLTMEGRSLDMRAAVGRLNRNIVLQGDQASTTGAFGGHTMIMSGGVALMDGVEFVRMGQFNKLARYPFHWHLTGNVAGQYIRNSVIRNSFQRGIVVHSTLNALVKNNIVFDSMGHSILLETPETIDNVIDGNLTVTNRVATHTEPTLVSQNDMEPAGFWIKGARNTIINNVAAGSTASGFWYDVTAESPTVFKNNTAYAAAARGRADFVRESGLLVQHVSTSTIEFENTLLYNNVIGLWPTHTGVQIYRQFSLVNNGVTAETTDDGRVKLLAPLLVGSVTSKPPGGALLVQYGATLDLEDPMFVNFGTTALLSANDILMPWMSDVRIKNARFVNTTKLAAASFPDVTVGEFLDDSYLPRGFYIPARYTMLAAPGMTLKKVGPAGDQVSVFHGPQRPIFGILETLLAGNGRFFGDGASGASLLDNTTIPLRRSDGLEYVYNEAFVGGYPLICNSALSYELKAQPQDTLFAVRINLNTGVFQTTDPIVAALAVPQPSAPKRVMRMSGGQDPNFEREPGTPITPATSLADWKASPTNRFFFDAGARLLYLHVGVATLVVER